MNSLKQFLAKIPFALGFMIGFWLLLGLVDLLKNYVAAINYGRDFDWGMSVTFVSTYSLSWILLSYPIFTIFNRLNNRSWPIKLSAQAGLSIVFGFLHILILSLMFTATLYDSQSAETSFWQFFYDDTSRRILPATVNSAVAYWVVIIILFAFDYYQKYQKQALVALQLESQLTQAKLQTLKMQLQPHFLFNAHNTISMLVRTEKYAQATNMISALSDLLRTSLTRSDTQLIPLQEEIDLLKKYLKIERARFEDRLMVNFDIDDTISEAMVPNLFLQPIVENAFKHGISRRMEEAEINISIRQEQQQLLITVSNSGPSLPPGWSLEAHYGIGLTNTINRLKQLYPGRYQFDIRNTANGKQGVAVEIQMPFELQEETIHEPV